MERAESGADHAALKSWYRGLLDRPVPDLVSAGTITGAAEISNCARRLVTPADQPCEPSQQGEVWQRRIAA